MQLSYQSVIVEKKKQIFQKDLERRKTSIRSFFGFKLYMIINDVGQIIAIKITKGNIYDGTSVA